MFFKEEKKEKRGRNENPIVFFDIAIGSQYTGRLLIEVGTISLLK
jgi:hypothetical protein